MLGRWEACYIIRCAFLQVGRVLWKIGAGFSGHEKPAAVGGRLMADRRRLAADWGSLLMVGAACLMVVETLLQSGHALLQIGDSLLIVGAAWLMVVEALLQGGHALLQIGDSLLIVGAAWLMVVEALLQGGHALLQIGDSLLIVGGGLAAGRLPPVCIQVTTLPHSAEPYGSFYKVYLSDRSSVFHPKRLYPRLHNSLCSSTHVHSGRNKTER